MYKHIIYVYVPQAFSEKNVFSNDWTVKSLLFSTFMLLCVGVGGHEAVSKSQQSLIISTSAWRTFTRTLPDGSDIQVRCMEFIS